VVCRVSRGRKPIAHPVHPLPYPYTLPVLLAVLIEAGYNCPVLFTDRVAAPPKKPLVIYDGECTFCCLLVKRWGHVTGDAVQYLPLQDPTLVNRFPELQRQHLETAVHLVEADGSVFQGARAVVGALAHGEKAHQKWPLSWYKKSRGFAALSEWIYRFIARHRNIISPPARFFLGLDAQHQSYDMVRRWFLRSTGAIYFVAFVSLWIQLDGLIGRQGVLPVKEGLETVRQATAQASMLERYHIFPTLSWFNSSDAFLHIQCAAGTLLAIVLAIGIAPGACLFLLWVLYLSLATVHREFLGFQWDNLLLEVGFLGIFLAPLQLLPWKTRARPPSLLMIWLFRWLLFRLMFESGCVKLLSGDTTWRDLTALTAHYQTQPLPTWIAWYAQQLPVFFHKICAVVMFAIELIVPFLIFMPRRLRLLACAIFFALQVAIFATGNYCFFNLLTMALCLFLLDDQALMRLAPSKWKKKRAALKRPLLPLGRWQWPRPIIILFAGIILWISLIQIGSMFHVPITWRPLVASYRWVAGFRTINSYGLFAVMTMQRPEIVVQGSNDGKAWINYEFKYKPGDVKRRPQFLAPYQPRLDWQMWFAALGNYRQNPWFINLCVHLLDGSQPVLHLLERNPFPAAPPRYVRALVYEYHFTNWAIRRRTGAWWQRELKGVYLPVLALREDVPLNNQTRIPANR